MNDQDTMMLEYLLSQGALNTQQQALVRKQAMIDALRKQSQMPQGEMTQTGAGTPSIYVRPHALQNLASIAGQGLAEYQQGGVNNEANQMGAQGQENLRRMMEQWRQRKAAGMSSPMVGGMPADPSFGGAGAAPY